MNGTAPLIHVADDPESPAYRRYAALVHQKINNFHAYGDWSRPLTPPAFAASAWYVASPMVSCYAQPRGDLHGVDVHCTQGALTVAIVLPHDVPAPAPNDLPGSGRLHVAPFDPGRTRVHLRADDWDLPAQCHLLGPELVAEASRVVRLLADHINVLAGPMVDRLCRLE